MEIRQVLFSFHGRITRREYWLKGILPMLGMSFIAVTILAIIEATTGLTTDPKTITRDATEIIVGIIWIPFGILLTIIQLAIFTKRWHDRGRTGWWNLIFFIPIIGSILFIIMLIYLGKAKGQTEENQYGPVPV